MALKALHVLQIAGGKLPLQKLYCCCLAFIREFFVEVRSSEGVKDLLMLHPALMTEMANEELTARASKRARIYFVGASRSYPNGRYALDVNNQHGGWVL
jgi:hypothetical protein